MPVPSARVFALTFALSLMDACAKGPQKPRAPIGQAGIEWVRISGGTFVPDMEDPAHPASAVTVSSFEIAKTPVTNKQYWACLKAGACTPPSSACGVQAADLPVVCVDWHQADAFAKWVGGRLPTGIEWEYAARSRGKDRKFPWGNEPPTCERAVTRACGAESAAPVCSKPRGNSEQGLCDMAGNVQEWVDEFSDLTSSPNSVRIRRGGSWAFEASASRVSARPGYGPRDRDNYAGFRPAR